MTYLNLMSLPHDLLLNCLAHVSRSYYPRLSLVSKRFRSLIASPELYKARSLLNCTESYLYVCINFDSHCHWFTLLPNTESSGYFLGRLPIPPSPVNLSGLVAVGSNIYHIHDQSSLSIFDCRSHTWREGPSLRVKLLSFCTSVVDRKIYVAGKTSSFKKRIEVFDTETQVWNLEPIPCSEINGDSFYISTCLDGKLHVMTHPEGNVAAYDSKEGRWDMGGPRMAKYMVPNCYCEIEKVRYSYSSGRIRWYDTEISKWRMVDGLEEVISKFPHGASLRMGNYGGKMAVFVVKSSISGDFSWKTIIWCAVIALERRRSRSGIWECGKIEWFGNVLTIPSTNSMPIMKVLAVTLFFCKIVNII